jgi:hypothetical protein
VSQLGELVVVLGVAALAAVVGLGFGIVVLAPRISRLLDRAECDEEPGGGHD